MTDTFGHYWEIVEMRNYSSVLECRNCGARMTSSQQGLVQTSGPEFCEKKDPDQ